MNINGVEVNMDTKMYSRPLSLKDVNITDEFWKNEMELIRKEVIPYQWEALNDRVPDAAPSFCMRNFKVAGKMNREKKEKGEAFHCRKTRGIWRIDFMVLFSRTVIFRNGLKQWDIP